ncbi:MAG: bile acid:sodium symporter [Gemmataceae bacterium]|nr:bile acid:sodium symporter [Gemmataceae bacterium]
MRAFFVQRWFLGALLSGVTLALLFPQLFQPWTGHLPPDWIIGCALFLMALTMPTRSLAGELRRPWAALYSLAISYGLVPILARCIAHLPVSPDLRVGLCLTASVPSTLASCVLWTRLAGGNEATALLVVLGGTSSSWLITPLLLTWLTGTQVELPVLEMMANLAVTLAAPVALGQALRLAPAAARFADAGRRPLGYVAQLFVLLIILKATTALGLRLESGAGLPVGFVAASAAFALGLHLMALFAGLWSSRLMGFDEPRCRAVAFAGSQKTLPIALLLLDRYFVEQFPLAILPLLFYHVGQLVLDTLIAERLKRTDGAADIVDAL